MVRRYEKMRNKERHDLTYIIKEKHEKRLRREKKRMIC